MNSVHPETIDSDIYNKTETLSSNKNGLIFLLSENQYLIGFIQGYCHAVGCKIKTLPISQCDHFLEILIKESPSVLFIDMTYLAQFFRRQEWTAISLIIRHNNIALCGIGKQPLNDAEALSELVFNKIFTEPFNLEEIRHYLNDITKSSTVLNNERRFRERRSGDRRIKSLLIEKPLFIEHDAEVVSIVKDLHKRRNSDHQPDEEQIKQIGPLVIDCLARTIAVNGVPIVVSQKEYHFIHLLAQQPGRVVNVDDIIKTIWAENKRATKADVHQYAYMLRNKLEENPQKPKLIITVKGFGYKLCP
jgi:DNA-binding response OmpR family regulator